MRLVVTHFNLKPLYLGPRDRWHWKSLRAPHPRLLWFAFHRAGSSK